MSSGKGWHIDSGDVVIDGNGTVLDGLDIHGSVIVRASNVVIQRSRITQTGQSWGIGLASGSNISIVNNEITSPTAFGANRLMVGIKDIYGKVSGLTVTGNDISHTSTGVQIGAGNVRGNYIHDMGIKDGDHINGFSSNSTSGALTIAHNTILNQIEQTDAIALFPDFGPQRDVTIQDNLLGGGGYTIYGGYDLGKNSSPSTNIVIRDNRITRAFYSNGGYYGWLAHFNPSGPGNVLAGNFWDDTGAALTGS